jgi:hypothetical protein
MVDWMIEVLTNFKCDDETFFLSINLMDRYFEATKKSISAAELHKLGVTSMFIASKYEDYHPIKMKIVYERITHKKIPIEDIKDCELNFMKALNY